MLLFGPNGPGAFEIYFMYAVVADTDETGYFRWCECEVRLDFIPKLTLHTPVRKVTIRADQGALKALRKWSERPLCTTNLNTDLRVIATGEDLFEQLLH